MISPLAFALVTSVILLAGCAMIPLAIWLGIKAGFREAYEKINKKTK